MIPFKNSLTKEIKKKFKVLDEKNSKFIYYKYTYLIVNIQEPN
mgnify:CR=1 FL=1